MKKLKKSDFGFLIRNKSYKITAHHNETSLILTLNRAVGLQHGDEVYEFVKDGIISIVPKHIFDEMED